VITFTDRTHCGCSLERLVQMILHFSTSDALAGTPTQPTWSPSQITLDSTCEGIHSSALAKQSTATSCSSPSREVIPVQYKAVPAVGRQDSHNTARS